MSKKRKSESPLVSSFDHSRQTRRKMTCRGTPSAQAQQVLRAHQTGGAIEEVPMQIIGAFDVHRKQITFKWLNTGTGEVGRGHITPALREKVREFLGPFKGLDAHFALEATTGWRFVAEEVSRAGLTTHLAEP